MNTFSLSIADFFKSVDKNFFTPSFGTYEHLGFLGSETTFKWAILALYFGLVIAAVAVYYNRCILGKAVRALDAAGCSSPERAMTLAELGLDKNIFIKMSLRRRNGTLARTVRHVVFTDGDTEVDGQNAERRKIDFGSDGFYLEPEKRDSAIQRFSEKGSGILSIVLVAVIGLVAVVLIFKCAPVVFNLLDAAIGGLGSAASGQ